MRTTLGTVVPAEDALLGVAGVAAEELVATVAGQHLAYAIFSRHLGAVVGGQRRRVAEGLVVVRGHGGDAAHQVIGRDVVLVVLGAETPGGDAGVLHLVVALGLEADRIGGRRLAATSPIMPATVELSVPPLRKHPGFPLPNCCITAFRNN